MEFNNSILSIWESEEDFQFSNLEAQPNLCEFAQSFQQWIEQLQRTILTDAPTVISVNQAKVLLLDRYFDWYQKVSKSHRNRIGEAGHTCIYQVFTQAYLQIRSVELSLMPPLLFIPPKPQFPGLYLGDSTGNDNG